jgi:hypothetical protein
VQVGLDRSGKDPEHLPVEEVEDVGEQQEGEDSATESPPLCKLRMAQKFTPSDSHTWRGLP